MNEASPFFKVLETCDAGAMHDMEKACFSLPWSLEQCQSALAQKSFAAFGLWRPGRLIAYVSCYHALDELEILNLAVEPASRRQGHGSRVLRMLLQTARKMGMQRAVLEVREGNFAAISLYEKAGFSLCGKRLKYYFDNGENALIYTRIL